MKIVEMPHWWSRTPQAQAEMDSVIAELRAKYPPKPRPIKPEGMSEADFVLSLQAQSTAAVLKMNEEELAAHKARPMVDNWKAVPDAKTTEEAVGQRYLDPREISHVEATRRRAKNSTGQSELSATNPEKRESAIQGFIFSPPARVTPDEVKAKAVNLVEYKSEPLTETWVELTWWQALIHRIKGNKIRIDPKE